MTLIYLAFAWTLGIVAGSQAAPHPFFITVGCLVSIIWLWLARRDEVMRLVFAILLCFGLGALRFAASNPANDAQHISRLNDQGLLTLQGVVIAEPVIQDEGLQLLLSSSEAAGRPANGRVLVRVPRESEIEYGDEVRLFGVLRTPPAFDAFSYADYLARQQVFSVMFNADVDVIQSDQGAVWRGWLIDAKNSAKDRILDALPEPQASLLVGILLGDESGLSDETRENFSRTGASHIIAISGFNMVILAQIMMTVLNQIIKRPSLAAALGVITIIIYTIFVGAGAAVLRAAAMSSVLIVAQSLQRRTYVPTSLAFTALLLSVLDPWVLWDVGFQLSFAAVIGMALFVGYGERITRPRLEAWLPDSLFRPVSQILSESVIVTLAAQITTTPIILYYFGNLSVASFIVNLLIIPVQTPLLLTGAMGTIAALIFAPLGNVLLYTTWVFLSWSVGVVEFFASASWAQQSISLPLWGLVLFFSVLGIGMIYQATRPRWAMALVDMMSGQKFTTAVWGAAIVVIVLQGVIVRQQPNGNLNIHFLAVGDSPVTLLQTPDGGTILVNGGGFPTRLLDALGDKLPFQHRTIDILIITSQEDDDIQALLELVERFEITTAMVPPTETNNATYLTILDRLTEQGTAITPYITGYNMTTSDGVQLDFKTFDASEDVLATALRVSYEQATILLTDNLNPEIESQLLTDPHWIQATILQVPEGGDGDASASAFLAVVNPQVAVFQTSRDPSPTIVARLADAEIFRTDRHGMISVRSDGSHLTIHTSNTR